MKSPKIFVLLKRCGIMMKTWSFVLLLYCLVGIVHASNKDPAEPVTKTVIDILSENIEFSYFLRVLQRNGAVPYLNQASNITLISPVNSAFFDILGCDSAQSCEASLNSEENVLKQLDINDYIVSENILFRDFNGYLIKEATNENRSPILLYSNISTGAFQINDIDVVELDLLAESQDSSVQGIDRLLPDALTLNKFLDSNRKISIFNNLYKHLEIDLPDKTIIIPVDSSFKFDEFEMNYLLSKYGKEDRANLLKNLFFDIYVGGDFDNEIPIKNMNGYETILKSMDYGNHLVINDTFISSKSNLLTSSNIIHLFEDQGLIPEIDMNLKKLLAGLNATDFIDELIFQNLEFLLTNNTLEQTLFLSKEPDQIVSILSKSSNLYHFVNERIYFSSTKGLYDTKLCNPKKFGSGCQRLKVSKLGSNEIILNNNVLIESGPYEVGNSLVYITDEDLKPPSNIPSSVNPAYSCSQSLQILDSLNLLKLPKNNLGYTIFLPCYKSWESFELTLNVFKNDLTLFEKLFKNLILNGLFYSDFNGKNITFENLNGENITIKKISTKDYDNEPNTQPKQQDGLNWINLEFNGKLVDIGENNDILFNEGVIHPIDEVLFPNDIDIPLKKIAQHSDSVPNLFLEYLDYFPELSELLNYSNYSILLPTSNSMLSLNPFKSNQTLEKFLRLHIIASSSLENIHKCQGDIETLINGTTLRCIDIPNRSVDLLKINNGQDFEIRIIGKGCNTKNTHSCVYLVDEPFELDWINIHDRYHLKLPGIALALGVLIGLLGMAIFGSCSLVFMLKSKDYPKSNSNPNSIHQSVASLASERSALLGEPNGSNTEQYNSKIGRAHV